MAIHSVRILLAEGRADFLYPAITRCLAVVDRFSVAGRLHGDAGALSALSREKIESAASVYRAL
jgi:hypothetical protein